MSVWRYEKAQVFGVRLAALAGMFVFMGLIIMGRIFYLQIIEGDKYTVLADKNRTSVRHLIPQRGVIFDRQGRRLAENKKNFQAVLIREEAKDYKKTLAAFERLIPLSEEEHTRILKEVPHKKAFMSVRLKENLTFDEVALIQVNAPDLPGIQIEEGLMRHYPYGASTAPVVGYVSLVNAQDEALTSTNPFLDIAGYRIGRTGIEQAFEETLRGTPGLERKEVNAFGRSVRVLEKRSPVAGEDLFLTLDAELQKYALSVLGDEAAAAIVMDVKNGDILAFVSAPTYDANVFTMPISTKNWEKLLYNKKRPLQNKALTGVYSPGSIFKLVVALAGLESGDISENTSVTCTGKTKLNDHVFHCWRPYGHGKMTVQSALMHSCDVYFYEMAQRIGPEKIIETARRLGFGAKVQTDLPGEKSGLVPTPEWKLAVKKDAWRTGDTLNLSIGQGFLNATPLQIVTAVAQIANGGYRLTPRFIKKTAVPASDDKVPLNKGEKLGFDSYHVALVKKGMYDVVNKERGTAHGARFDLNGLKMAGKTASTQVRRITMKERLEGIKSQDELPWEYRDHAIFAAYAPADKPRYAVVVLVEHGGGGARTAAPMAAKILKEALRRFMPRAAGEKE